MPNGCSCPISLAQIQVIGEHFTKSLLEQQLSILCTDSRTQCKVLRQMLEKPTVYITLVTCRTAVYTNTLQTDIKSHCSYAVCDPSAVYIAHAHHIFRKLGFLGNGILSVYSSACSKYADFLYWSNELWLLSFYFHRDDANTWRRKWEDNTNCLLCILPIGISCVKSCSAHPKTSKS